MSRKAATIERERTEEPAEERAEERAGERGEERAEEQAAPPEQAAPRGKTTRRRRSGEAATPRGVGSGARKAAGGDEDEAGEAPVRKKPAGVRNADLGRRGEDAAARFLDRRGYEIVERNWTCAAGEADIIARDEETVVFVEVKTRSSCERGLPSEAVDAEKRERYERIAALFLQGYDVVDVPVRFDIISLVVIGPDRAMIRHHINAFSAE